MPPAPRTPARHAPPPPKPVAKPKPKPPAPRPKPVAKPKPKPIAHRPLPSVPAAKPKPKPKPAGGSSGGVVGRLIGYPYQGTHAVAFNRAGGSDNWQSENAVDIALPIGTAILAVRDGVISPGGYGYGQSPLGGRFAGWRLHLVSPNGLVSFYTHLERLTVPQGAHVRRGQVIGRSGEANGVAHLHYAVNPPHNPLSYWRDTFDASNTDVVPQAPGTSSGTGGIPEPLPGPTHRPAKLSTKTGPLPAWKAMLHHFAVTWPQQGLALSTIGKGLLRKVSS